MFISIIFTIKEYNINSNAWCFFSELMGDFEEDCYAACAVISCRTWLGSVGGIGILIGARAAIPMSAKDLEDALEMGMDWSLREG